MLMYVTYCIQTEIELKLRALSGSGYVFFPRFAPVTSFAAHDSR